MYTKDSIHCLVEKQRQHFNTKETYPIANRINNLVKLKNMLLNNEKEIEEALQKDLGRHSLEAYFCDIGSTVLEINETIHGLRRWAKPKKMFSGLITFPSIFTNVYRVPYGVTLIISPFNFPFILSVGVLCAAIAGGNTAVIKASSKSVNSTALLKRIISETFDEKFVTVIDGGHDVADMCLEERFDKIFYTGSPKVGVHVLEMAAKNLTPVALELGGEMGNWAIIREDADIKDAARKIAFFKMCNSGQICININQVAVEKSIADEFIAEFSNAVKNMLPDPLTSDEYSKLIDKNAYDKCEKLANEYKDKIVFGGKGSPERLCFEPTLIYPVSIDDDIVKRELFCPLLPVVTYDSEKTDELIKTIEEREHGLSLYIFTKNVKWAKKTMAQMQFGGGCINEVCLHMMVKGAPFNGTGHSGMGAYHGEYGFNEFTHPTTILIGSNKFNLPLREHPYSGKTGIIKKKIIKCFER